MNLMVISCWITFVFFSSELHGVSWCFGSRWLSLFCLDVDFFGWMNRVRKRILDQKVEPVVVDGFLESNNERQDDSKEREELT